MQVEFRLKRILEEAGQDTHGRIEKIARGATVNRHTVRRIYSNEAVSVSLDTVGRICDWLEKKKLCKGLPGLGEYRSTGFPKYRVARDDAAAASMLIHRLSRFRQSGKLLFEHVHVPSHIPDDHKKLRASAFKKDKDAAEIIFDGIREDRAAGTAVLIGSQRANYLVEWWVSELLGCPAFAPNAAVPFFLSYQEEARYASCFGGNEPPTKRTEDRGPGIYFRQGKDWHHLESKPGKKGAGVVIIRRAPGFDRLEMAVFGVSAISTAAMATYICDSPDWFWPKTARFHAGLETAIYLCGFEVGDPGEEEIDSASVKPPTIIKLDVRLPGRRTRKAGSAKRRAGR
jgi:hypothetical protein